jgi:Domain of unknown function (DUF4406)
VIFEEIYPDFLELSETKHLDLFVRQVASFMEMHTATYVSAPITTGLSFVQWYANEGIHFQSDDKLYKLKHSASVVVPNLSRIKSFAKQQRRLGTNPVIEPASFDNPYWSQSEYLYYWGKVISSYVRDIICLDGWEYSRGCAFEYLVGKMLNLKIVDEVQRQIPIQQGIMQLKEARNVLANHSYDLSMHTKVIDFMELNLLIR